MALEMMVCPHDTASNPDRWYVFLQYLAQHLDTQMQFDVALDFADFQQNLARADLVYANPSDTLKLIAEGLSVLARPSNLHDEVVFVANPEIENPSLESLNGQELVSVAHLQPTKLALHILKEKGITPSGIADRDSWTAVIGSIWRGEANYGLLYRDTYQELSEQGKGMVQAFYSSDERVNFHNMLVGRKAADQQEAIAQILQNMHTDEKGKEVLSELGIEQWVPTTQDDIENIRRIIENY